MKKDHFKWLTFVSALLFLQIIYVYAFFIEPNWIQVRQIKITDESLANALSGLRIVQISDLHVENMGYREVSLIEKINNLKPDIILITGDMVGSNEGSGALWDVFALLEPKFHSYAVLGDCDGPLVESVYLKQWDRANVYLLTDKAVRVNLKQKADTFFWLVGLSSDNLKETTRDIPGDEPVILANHRPDIVKSAAMQKINLVLAGHTHGGQVGIPLLWKLFPYAKRSEYIAGLYKVKDTLLYVNRGISAEKGLRLFCRPEITLFEFVPGGNMRYRTLAQDN